MRIKHALPDYKKREHIIHVRVTQSSQIPHLLTVIKTQLQHKFAKRKRRYYITSSLW